MAPLFTREALEQQLPAFGDTLSCWGLERKWAHDERAAGRRILRLDARPIDHLRPIGTGAAYGPDAMGEYHAFMKKYGLPP